MENKTILEDYEEILGNKKLTNGQEKALLSAINLFAKQGYDATSTAQIAKMQVSVKQPFLNIIQLRKNYC